MSEIICFECKASVSDTTGYCPECGYHFDVAQVDQNNNVSGDSSTADQKTIVTTPLDIIMSALDYIRLEMKALSKKVSDIKCDADTGTLTSAEKTNQMLAEIVNKLDTLVSMKCSKELAAQVDEPKKSKKTILAAFYKTLNSPNSTFEYMFYICLIQLIFVIVNLLLVTYVVTLVR